MEVDTGVAVSIISDKDRTLTNTKSSHFSLPQPDSVHTQERLLQFWERCGQVEYTVKCSPLLVVQRTAPSLIGGQFGTD